MPRLILQRQPFRKGQPTQGGFYLHDAGKVVPLRIDSLELPWANNAEKVSCIPPDTYSMRWSHSPKFGINTWELEDVPGRSAIRIHAGNYAGPHLSDSLGCILPCMEWSDINHDGVMDGLSSRLALSQLEAVLAPFQDTGLDIEIRNG